MRFCTTCGRNFEGTLPECPHDGTPLFDMGAPTKEPLLAAASEPWSATSHSEADASAEIEVDNAEIGLVDIESKSKEFPSPVVNNEIDVQSPIFSDDDPDLDVSEGKSPIDLESALFDDDDESSQIAPGIDDLGANISASEVKILQKEEVILDDALAPIKAKTSSGGNKLIPILLVLLLLGAAGFYFVGGGQEMLARPTKEEPKPKKATPVKKNVIKVEKPIEKPVEKPIEKPIEDPIEKPVEVVDEKIEKVEPAKVEPVKVVKKRVKKKVRVKKIKKVEKVEKVDKVEKVEKIVPKKKVVEEPKKKVVEDDPEEMLRKELEAMEGK